MCKQPKCNWLRHLLGKCEHRQQVEQLQQDISKVRNETVKDVKSFNRSMTLIINDDNIRFTLQKINEVTR